MPSFMRLGSRKKISKKERKSMRLSLLGMNGIGSKISVIYWVYGTYSISIPVWLLLTCYVSYSVSSVLRDITWLTDHFKIISLSPLCLFQQSVLHLVSHPSPRLPSFTSSPVPHLAILSLASPPVPCLTSRPLPCLLYLASPFLLPALFTLPSRSVPSSPSYLHFSLWLFFTILQFYSVHYRAFVVLILDLPGSLLPSL